MPYSRRDRGGLGVLLLGTQLMNVGFGNIPPVTLGLILGQAAIFLDVLPQYFPSDFAVCLSSYNVWYYSQWKRLILAAFYHANDMHLYFNMVSLLWKGMALEKRFHSTYFAYLVAVFTVLTSVVYVAINMMLENVLEDSSYRMQCAVGFSGVLFALKVLTTHYSPQGLHYALGFIPVPSRWIYWAELVLIQLMVPQASFTGHLAGIVVGLLYVKGPLKAIMDAILLPGTVFRGPSYQYTSRSTGYRPGYEQTQQGHYRMPEPSAPFMNPKPPHVYTGGMSEEEQYQRALEESLRDRPPTNRLYPDLDDLRQRRLDRYS